MELLSFLFFFKFFTKKKKIILEESLEYALLYIETIYILLYNIMYKDVLFIYEEEKTLLLNNVVV